MSAHRSQMLSDVRRTMELIAAFRKTMPSMAISDILAARHEGNRH
jgi:hypothetical protein